MQTLTYSPHAVVAIYEKVLCYAVVLLENRGAGRAMLVRFWVTISVT